MPTTTPEIKVLLDMDNTLLHTIEIPANRVKDYHVVIEETPSGVLVSRLRPSTTPLLEALSAKGYTLCVMTSGSRDLQEEVLLKLGIRDFFTELYCGEDLTHVIALNADAFVLVDDLDVELGAGTKLAVLGVPEVWELKFTLEFAKNLENRQVAKQRLYERTAPYFVKCDGWCGAFYQKDTDVQPLTSLVAEIEDKIHRQL